MKSMIASSLLLCAGLGAQATTVELHTQSDVAVVANAGSKTAHDSVAKNTKIKNLRVHANLSSSNNYYMSVTSLAYPNGSGRGVNIIERGYCRGKTTDTGGTSSSLASTGAKIGSHSYLMIVKGKPGTKGHITWTWHSKGALGANMTGELDIGNDNTVEFKGKANEALFKKYPVTLGSTPLVIKITTHGTLVGTNAYSDWVNYFADYFINFVPDETTKTSFAIYGSSCGPVLTGNATTVSGAHQIKLTMVSGFPNAFAISAIGNQQLNLPLGGGCSLLSNALTLALLKSDATGMATESYKIPSTSKMMSYHQFLPIQLQGANLILKASNGLNFVAK